MFEDRSRGVGGRLGDNVDVARALACARAHSTSIIFYYFNYFVSAFVDVTVLACMIDFVSLSASMAIAVATSSELLKIWRSP